MILIIMGVSGAGKTTVGKALAEKDGMFLSKVDGSQLSYEFHDADDFHPNGNIQKMAAGIALTDEDRLPWLDILQDKIKTWRDGKINSVLACSALKKSYRFKLISGAANDWSNCPEAAYTSHDNSFENRAHLKKTLMYVYLNGTLEFIYDRISKRVGHFMPLELLQSQFRDLEEPQQPENFINVDTKGNVNEVVDEIIGKIFKNDEYL